MKRNWLVAVVMMLALLAGPVARAADDQAAQSYTGPEYAAFNAAVNEKDATQRVKLLDDFVAKYPKSTLLPYVFQSYFLAYSELRNYIQVMAYCDKLLTLGDAVDALQGLGLARLQALELRGRVFFLALGQRQLTTNDQYTSARDSANLGLKFLADRKKPEGLTDEQFAQQNTSLKSLFFSVNGFASSQVKDFKAAADAFRSALAISPNDAALHYRLGLSSLQQDPPQQMDGYWEIARAIALKVQGEAQVRNYLKSQLNKYQLPTCDALLEAQLNELIALAGTAAERPANFKIPSRAELDTVMQGATVDVILNDLKGGGDRAKIVWLAVCGAEFPELGGKVFEVADGENGAVILKLFTAAKEEELEAGTAPNMQVHVEGQPAAKRLKKDDIIAYAATLKSFTPDPFMIQLEKGKVREDTLPPEATAPSKKAPPKKAPAKRPPTKRPPA